MTTLKEKLGSEGQRDMEDSGRLPCDLIGPDTASIICCLFSVSWKQTCPTLHPRAR